MGALHRAGMVEEAEQRNARERWWQRSGDSLLIPNSVPQDASAAERAELNAAHSQTESILVERDENAMRRWMDVRYELPLEWQDAQWIGSFRLWATAEEVREFVQAVIELAEPLRKVPEKGDSQRLEAHFTFRVLPQERTP